MARAGISSSAALATMALIRLAPSSSENSVWLWRRTNVSGACGIVVDGMAGLPILDFPGGSGASDAPLPGQWASCRGAVAEVHEGGGLAWSGRPGGQNWSA